LINNISTLAEATGLGRIYDCGSCARIHLQVGPMDIAFSREGYLQLVDMVNRSAANFELLLEQRAPGGGTGDSDSLFQR
jgi:hypothetical protein